MKKVAQLPFLTIDSIPQLVKDFLNKSIEDTQQKVFSINNIENQFLEKKENFTLAQRQNLVQVFQGQYVSYSLSEKQKHHLGLLMSADTFTVTTGHQLNLFTGPAFFIYKILQTIKLAGFLCEKFPNQHFVPIFWLASEDHDFQEINHFKTDNQYFEIQETSGGVVGQIQINDVAFVQQFEAELKDTAFGESLILMMKKAYAKGNTLAQATRILTQELFGDHGLMVLDGDDPLLKSEMKPIFKEELLHHTLKKSTERKIDSFTDHYGKVQVNPREINLFYLSNTRDRISRNGDQFEIVDRAFSFSKDELLAELELFPEKFSPNAVMRPVFQEKVLPNIAYIGGNAEIMYWLELTDYFNHLSLPFPILIPRNSMLMVSEKIFSTLGKLGLRIQDLFKKLDIVYAKLLLNQNEILVLLKKQESDLKRQFQLLKTEAGKTDPTFKNLVEAEETRQLRSFKRMKKRLLRAEKIKQKEKVMRLANVYSLVHPADNWQERVYNFSVFYADHGPEWLKKCYDAIDVENSELIIFSI